MIVDIDPYPLMGTNYGFDAYAPLDLSKSYLNTISNLDIKSYIAQHHRLSNARFLWGGYLEERSIYQSELFLENQDIRDVHLGIDIWGIVYDLIYAPLDGVIHSYAYNDQALDYGYTLVLKHELSGNVFYTLYGHLGDSYFAGWEVGRKVAAGEVIADLGPKATNGGWLPHLHFQLIMDMGSFVGDFPGVCSKRDLRKYKELCPDPLKLITPIKKAPSS